MLIRTIITCYFVVKTCFQKRIGKTHSFYKGDHDDDEEEDEIVVENE